jgi:hypothetical protein
MLATQYWRILPGPDLLIPRWLYLSLAGFFIVSGSVRYNRLFFPAAKRDTRAYNLVGYLQDFIFTMLFTGVTLAHDAPPSLLDYLPFVLIGSFLVGAALVWAASRPLVWVGYLPDEWFLQQITGTGLPLHTDRRVLEIIHTPRLYLLALKPYQLGFLKDDPPAFEKELKLKIAPKMLTGRILQIQRKRVQALPTAQQSEQLWYASWLLVLKKGNLGIGLAGFDGPPDQRGTTTLSYELDLAYDNHGYMLETARNLRDWAFQYSSCNSVIVKHVTSQDFRNHLEMLGARLVAEDEIASSWEFIR